MEDTCICRDVPLLFWQLIAQWHRAGVPIQTTGNFKSPVTREARGLTIDGSGSIKGYWRE